MQETIAKTDASGKLLPEMILICQNLRNNLQHPNEYIRGVTLRFLCRIHEEEILEPLVPSVIANLEHRHSYVRKNAVKALSAIYRLPKGELLVPDAPELVEKMLSAEQDLGTRRNAFQMLSEHAQDRAISYLFDNIDRLADWGDILQMAVLDLIRRVCRTHPETRGRYIKVILALLQSRSSAVVYECATTLVALSNAPTAVRAAASCFVQLLVSHSDNNVKLIILDRLAELKEKHRDVLAELLMDSLRALSAPNLDVRKKLLDVMLDLVGVRTVEEVVSVLKKEAMKTQSHGVEQGAEYRSLLVHAIHDCAFRFPDVASSVLTLLMDFLSDSNAASALDVAHLIREIVQTNSRLHDVIVEGLLEALPSIKAPRVAACTLWILSEYCVTTTEIESAIEAIQSCIGPLPLVRADESEEDNGKEDSPKEEAPAAPIPKARPAVLADGSYATQTALPGEPLLATGANVSANGVSGHSTSIRGMLLEGDYFVGAVLAATLTKFLLRLITNNDLPKVSLNRKSAEMMFIVASVLRLGESGSSSAPMDLDARDRMAVCLRVMAKPTSHDAVVWLQESRASFEAFLSEKQRRDAAEARLVAASQESQPDDLLALDHLLKSKKHGGLKAGKGGDMEMDADILAATGQGDGSKSASGGSLSKVVQLTGFSDPIYAEAYVTSHRYDIVLDVSVSNRTQETLQNVTLELATMGDLKLVERPQSHTLAPGAQRIIRANIKVSSTETGAIFGNLVFESTGRGGAAGADRNVVVLSDIHIDIMDYIQPANCPDMQFRTMWAEFEWENKVAINTPLSEPKAFLDHIIAMTNMRCLTPSSALSGDCGFLAANLYARSVFGEDALVNVSVEKLEDGKLSGYIRIRSKTQGIALSLGDKLIVQASKHVTAA